VYVPPKQFLVEIQSFCAEHGILLIVDETMTGWGRTGRWFASEHFELKPDIMTTAKGITSAYVPLGAVIMSGKVRRHFDTRTFVAGSTNEGHALACAAGIANIEVYESERLIERSASLGLHLAQRLNALRARHPSIGDVRSLGLFGCIELTGGQRNSEPLAGYRDQYGNIAKDLTRRLLDLGVAIVAKWDYLFIAPPLTITQEALEEGLDALDVALEIADKRFIQRRGTTEAAAGAG
jgi:taurine--2-oxoglutarate transaminase